MCYDAVDPYIRSFMCHDALDPCYKGANSCKHREVKCKWVVLVAYVAN